MLGALTLALFVYTGICAVIAGAVMFLFHLVQTIHAHYASRPAGGAKALRDKVDFALPHAASVVLGSGLIASLSPSFVMSLVP